MEIEHVFATVLVLCCCFGYGFWLGWWARGQRLSALEHICEALANKRLVTIDHKKNQAEIKNLPDELN